MTVGYRYSVAKKRKTSSAKPWKVFEKAVNDFLKSLLKDDPNASVRYDPPKTDRDTREKQQVDAWIEYRIGGHVPVHMLVSCKDHNRKLDIGDIRTFLQEIEDSGASTGAIYSRSGFTKGATAKANARGIGCFQLWKDRPADTPVIEVYRRYWCWDSVTIPLVVPGDAGLALKTWDELFDFRVTLGALEQSLADYIEEQLRKGKDLAVKERKTTGLAFPEDITCVVELNDSPTRGTTITIECRWKRYQGKLSASLLNGSYCVSTGHFVGTESAMLPVTFPPPASDWEELSVNPLRPTGIKDFLFTKNSAGLIAILKSRLAGQLIEPQ